MRLNFFMMRPFQHYVDFLISYYRRILSKMQVFRRDTNIFGYPFLSNMLTAILIPCHEY